MARSIRRHVHGRQLDLDRPRTFPDYNPSDGSGLGQHPRCRRRRSARRHRGRRMRPFPAWAALPFNKRAALI